MDNLFQDNTVISKTFCEPSIGDDSRETVARKGKVWSRNKTLSKMEYNQPSTRCLGGIPKEKTIVRP